MADGNEPDVSPSYVTQFHAHIAQVKAHLSGETKDVLPPSFIAPGGYWSTSEKNAFFHALARYSRLRPDLIAARVKTKSTVDICAYIEQLQLGSKANPIPWRRQDIEIAFNVSDEWVEFEEQNARALTAVGPIWDGEQRKVSRQAELTQKQNELQNNSDSFDEWRRDAEPRWNREDALNCLDDDRLNVLEGILRTGDPTEHIPNGTVIDYQEPDSLQSPSSEPRPSIVRQGTIDPMSRLASPAPSNPPGSSSQPSTPNPGVGDELQQLPPAPTRPSDSIIVPQSEPARDDPAPRMGLEELSPVSRRRLQKRLYMRRKRAERSGQSADYAIVKLRPGRERRDRKPKPRSRKYNTGKRKREDVGMDDQEVFPKLKAWHSPNDPMNIN